MLINDITSARTEGRLTLSAMVTPSRTPAHPFQAVFEFDGIDERDIRPRGDPFLASMLLPAMALGEDIEVEGPVSPMLGASVERILDIYAAWAPLVKGRPTMPGTFGRPSVRATVQPACTHGDRTALFFSGGVDSWFELFVSQSNGIWHGARLAMD